MTRYILIDTFSGYVWGDTADLDCHEPADPIAACRTLDEELGISGRNYFEVSASDQASYEVKEAPDGFPPVIDGRDPETIDRVAELPTVARIAYTE